MRTFRVRSPTTWLFLWTTLAVAPSLGAQLVTYREDLPRVMLFVEESGGTATSLLTGFLREAGFHLIDPAFARTAMERELARQALEGDDQAATELGRSLGAQVLILGEVPSEAAPNPADRALMVGTAHLSIRALRLDEARLVAIETTDGRGIDATGVAATAEAVRRAVDVLLQESSFVGDLVIDWQGRSWDDEAYWEPGPGSVEAQMKSAHPATAEAAPPPTPTESLQIAILESETFPDSASTGTRGIEIVRAQPVRARIRGLVSAPAASVDVEGTAARVVPLSPDQRETLGLEAEAAEFSAEVRLPGNQSRVRIRASANGRRSEVEISPRVGERWAVVVGISEYADDRIPDLRYADDDARSVYEFLRSPEGGEVPEGHIRLLVNEHATAAALREALFVFLQEADVEDFVTVYVASHGSPDPRRPENLYLLPYDADVDAIAATAFPMWDVKTALRRQIAAERVVVVADACRSAGALVGEANPMAGAFSELFSPSRRMTLSAAGLNEVSFEDARWGGGHGAFTYHLLEGLRGAADVDGDGVVTFREAAWHVRTTVSQDTDGAQNPEWTGLGDVPLSYLGRG